MSHISSPRYSRCYAFHDVCLTIDSDQSQILEALHIRLRHFPTNHRSETELVFTFDKITGGTHHVIRPPSGSLRPIYDPPLGEVVYADEMDQLYIRYGDDACVLCDGQQGRVQVSYTESVQANLWLLTCPLFTIPLIELLKRQQRFSLHAAGVCIDGAGMLLPGTSGAGKTTLTLALLRGGWNLLSDDMVFLAYESAHRSSSLRALAFPDAIDITDATAHFFPELQEWVKRPRGPGWAKHQLQFEAIYGSHFTWSCKPAILVFPTISDEVMSRLMPMTQQEALLELAPNVLLTEALSSQQHLDGLADLIRSCRCYRMAVGRDFDTIPNLLRGLMLNGVEV